MQIILKIMIKKEIKDSLYLLFLVGSSHSLRSTKNIMTSALSFPKTDIILRHWTLNPALPINQKSECNSCIFFWSYICLILLQSLHTKEDIKRLRKIFDLLFERERFINHQYNFHSWKRFFMRIN